MAPQTEVLAAKPDGLSSISGTHVPSLPAPRPAQACPVCPVLTHVWPLVLSKQPSNQTVLPSPSKNPHSPPGLQSDLAGHSRESVRLLVAFSWQL